MLSSHWCFVLKSIVGCNCMLDYKKTEVFVLVPVYLLMYYPYMYLCFLTHASIKL